MRRRRDTPAPARWSRSTARDQPVVAGGGDRDNVVAHALSLEIAGGSGMLDGFGDSGGVPCRQVAARAPPRARAAFPQQHRGARRLARTVLPVPTHGSPCLASFATRPPRQREGPGPRDVERIPLYRRHAPQEQHGLVGDRRQREARMACGDRYAVILRRGPTLGCAAVAGPRLDRDGPCCARDRVPAPFAAAIADVPGGVEAAVFRLGTAPDSRDASAALQVCRRRRDRNDQSLLPRAAGHRVISRCWQSARRRGTSDQ